MAQPKPGRSEQSLENDSFGALVDSSIRAEPGNDGAGQAAPQPAASERRTPDAASTDKTRSRAASPDRTARGTSNDRDVPAKGPDDSEPANGLTKEVDQRPHARTAESKESTSEPTERSSSEASSSDPAAPQDGTASATASAVAVAIAAAVVMTDVPVVDPPASSAASPLGIAAAAITASAATVATPVQANVASDKALPPGSPITAAPPSDVEASASPADTTQTARPENIPVEQPAADRLGPAPKQPVTQTLATPDVESNAAVAVVSAAPPKTAVLKAPAGTAPGATSDTSEAKPDTAGNAATPLAPGLPAATSAAGAKPDSAPNEKPEPDSAGTASPASSIPSRSPSPATAAGHAGGGLLEPGTQAAGPLQPQIPVAPSAVPSAASLGVTAATNAPVPLSGLAVEIAASARSGKSHFDIRLDPADLGRIDVRIDVDRNGQVTSHLTVEKPETLSMLRQDAPHLQRALDDAGFKTGDGGLQFSLRNQSSSGHNERNESGRNAQRLVIGDEDTIPAAVAGRSYGRVLGSSGGVDIRV
jgi:flagellar hook-length control protein FliK